MALFFPNVDEGIKNPAGDGGFFFVQGNIAIARSGALFFFPLCKGGMRGIIVFRFEQVFVLEWIPVR